MYITINDIIGEARIDLSYPIRPRKEISVVSMLSDNVQYWLQGTFTVHGKGMRWKFISGT